MIEVRIIKDGSNWYLITKDGVIDISGYYSESLPYELEQELKKAFGIPLD